MYSVSPVSYTHLDVYKRQVILSTKCVTDRLTLPVSVLLASIATKHLVVTPNSLPVRTG